MKYVILIFVLLACLNRLVYAQDDGPFCATEGSMALKSAQLSFIDISNEPIKHLRTNFIFLRRDDGTGGFQENNPDHQQYINDIITNLNNIYSNIPSSYSTDCYNGYYGVYNDSKIRFDANIMYIDDTYNWNNENSVGSYYPFCPGYQGYHLTNLNNQIAQNSPEPALNVFFTEDESAFQSIVINQNCPYTNLPFDYVSCSEYPSHNDFNNNQSVHLRNVFLKYYWMMNCVVDNNCNNPAWINDPPTWEEAYSWLGAGRVQAHELAHSFGIGHVSYNDCFHCLDYLMNNNGCSWGNFISPIDIGLMHHALSHTSARKYVPADTYSSTPFSFSQNTTWDDDARIYRGIHVNNGVTLEILDNLFIPSETGITVTDGSGLAIENSRITTPHTNSILNITFEQNSTVSVANSTITNCNVSVHASELTIENSIIELGENGEFVINLGSEFLMTNSTIQ